jgi:hypothetical protein
VVAGGDNQVYPGLAYRLRFPSRRVEPPPVQKIDIMEGPAPLALRRLGLL